MKLTKGQLAMYRAEWGKARKAMRKMGKSPKEADAMRYTINAQRGAPRSSIDDGWTNEAFDRVLAAFFSWSAMADLALQQRQVMQQLDRQKWTIRRLIEMCVEIDKGSYTLHNDEAARDFIRGDKFLAVTYDKVVDRHIAKAKQAKTKPLVGDFTNWERPHGDGLWLLQAAMTYRYSQIVKATLGYKNKPLPPVFWPSGKAPRNVKQAVPFPPQQHEKHLEMVADFARYSAEIEAQAPAPVAAGDPF